MKATAKASWRHNGNVARLPKELREKINCLIEDGVSYPAILRTLGEPVQHLNVVNLCRWKKGGYQDWLAERAFVQRIEARQERPAELVKDFDSTLVNEAALQLGTLHVFEALRDLDHGPLDQAWAAIARVSRACSMRWHAPAARL